MKKKKAYLTKEDELLLQDIKDMGPLSTGTELEEQKRKMLIIQTEATLRNRKTMIDLDKSNKRFSLVVGFFALIQIIIAMFQFGLDALTQPNRMIGLAASVLFFFFILYMLWVGDKEIGNK